MLLLWYRILLKEKEDERGRKKIEDFITKLPNRYERQLIFFLCRQMIWWNLWNFLSTFFFQFWYRLNLIWLPQLHNYKGVGKWYDPLDSDLSLRVYKPVCLLYQIKKITFRWKSIRFSFEKTFFFLTKMYFAEKAKSNSDNFWLSELVACIHVLLLLLLALFWGKCKNFFAE